jgi:replication factor C subunit 3/5
VAEAIAKESGRDLRRALLMMEASHVRSQGHITTQNLVVNADWEVFLKEVAQDMLLDQTPAKLQQVRTKLYDLLAHCIPAETIIKGLVEELLPRVDSVLKPVFVREAAFYEHRLRLGSKHIYHLEAFCAKVMSVYKQFLQASSVM